MNQNPSSEIFAALRQLERDRGIPVEYMTERITQALLAAYKKDRVGYTDNVFVELNEKALKMYAQKEVVEEVVTAATEIQLEAARRIDPHCELGDLVNEEIETQAFGRIAAQTAKQVIIQGIREAENNMVYNKFSSKQHEIITAVVSRIDNATGEMNVRIGQGSDRTEARLSTSEQVQGEHYREGDLIRVYVVDVRRGNRGTQIIVSRTHPGLVKRLFELNVPEIASGEVEIMSIAREAGSRSKLAVRAVDETRASTSSPPSRA